MEINANKIQREKLRWSQDTYEIMRRVFFCRKDGEVDRDKEHFWTIALNMASKILCIELVSMGSSVRTLAPPQEVFRLPIYKKATHVVLVHNHPSGNLSPSEGDKDVTDKLIQAGLVFDIEVSDHVIVTSNSFYSFADNGLIEKLKWSRKYALTFVRDKQMAKEIEKIKKQSKQQQKIERKEGKIEGIKEGEKKGEEKGIKNRNKEIAIQMMKEGVDVKLIQKITGLTHQWLGRLRSESEEEK
jgi:DNA repair protein RadC